MAPLNRRLLAIVGAAGAVLAVLWMQAPDTGPPVAAAPPPSAPSPAARRPALPVAVRPAGLPTEDLVDELPSGPPVRRPAPLPPIDPDQVFSPELRGVASAAVSRRELFQACWDRYGPSTPDPGYDGRLTVQITVSPAGDHGEVHTEVLNGPPEPAFQDCMAEVLADARFEAPDHDVSMIWPVPIVTDPRSPEGPPEPP